MRKEDLPYFINSRLGLVYRFGREFGVAWETWSNGHTVRVLGEFIIDNKDYVPTLKELPDLMENEICLSIIQREIELLGKSYRYIQRITGKSDEPPVLEIFEEIYKPYAKDLIDELMKIHEQN
jgi:hypothetical protein